MKKIYLLFIGVCLTTLAFSQVPVTWWAYLPADFLTNQPTRDVVQIRQVEDSYVTEATSLEELWTMHINDVFKTPIDFVDNPTVNDWSSGSEVSVELTQPDSADYYGEMSFLASANMLYMIIRMADDEIIHTDDAGDRFELAIAPYGDPYDPGRTIYANLTDAPEWQWDAETGYYKFGDVLIHPDTIVMMAPYGLWGETGACKYNLIPQTSLGFDPPQNTVFDDITANGDTLDITPGSGVGPVQFGSLVEATTGGYFYLVAMPWAMFAGGNPLMAAGDAISLGVQARDFDNDNETYENADGNDVVVTNVFWGGADHGQVYCFPVFYGARAELVVATDISKEAAAAFNVYYASNKLYLEQNLASLEIYSVTGALVKSMVHLSGTVDLSDLRNGLYIANMKNEKGESGALKFVKY